jgi:hypothetical protein
MKVKGAHRPGSLRDKSHRDQDDNKPPNNRSRGNPKPLQQHLPRSVDPTDEGKPQNPRTNQQQHKIPNPQNSQFDLRKRPPQKVKVDGLSTVRKTRGMDIIGEIPRADESRGEHMLEASLGGMSDVVETGVVESAGFEEGDIEAGSEIVVHVLVDNVVCFTADESGFEKVVGELADEGVRGSGVGSCHDCVGCSEEDGFAAIG